MKKQATAIVVERDQGDSTRYPYGYEIQDGDEAGIVFVASDRPWWLVGETVTVQYVAADQFARRIEGNP